MNSLRLLYFSLITCLLGGTALSAPSAVTPFTLEKPASANVAVTMKNGMIVHAKAFMDGEKIRADVTMNEMAMTIIIRKDTQKIDELMAAQKMAMEMNYDPSKFKGYAGLSAAFGAQGKFELVGPETVNGVACTKYKVESDDSGKVFYFWLDTARQVPVKMAAADGSIVVDWTNYVAGPQDPSLFEVPAGFQVIPMQGMPGGSGGA